MALLVHLLTALLPLLYGLAAGNYAVYFIGRDAFAKRTSSRFLAAVVLIHGAFLGLWAAQVGRYPIATLPEFLSMTAFALAAVYLYVERVRRNKSTGVFIVALVTLVQVGASTLLPHAVEPKAEFLRSPLFSLHTMAAVVGFSALALGAVYATMFLLLYRSLKSKNFGLLFERLPSLDVLATMALGATLVGWLFLTATIAMGTAMGSQLLPDFHHDPQFLTGVLVWAFYGVSLGLYFLRGWRGARIIIFWLAGFVLSVLGMTLSRALWNSFHRFFA